jgi:hypothetical protein
MKSLVNRNLSTNKAEVKGSIIDVNNLMIMDYNVPNINLSV